MRETLYIRLRDAEPDAPLAHAVVVDPAPGAPPSVVVRTLPREEVLGLAAGRRVIAFAPATAVRLTSVNVPARQPAKVLQAAPFVLEEQFADDVDMLHFALGSRATSGSWPIAAVARSQMDAWLAPFEDAGIALAALVPETLALPWAEGGAWSVLAEDGQLCCRTGAASGFACATGDFDLFLAAAGATAAQPLRVILPRGVADDFSGRPQPVDLLPGFDDPLQALVRSHRGAAGIDLLQGPYSQRQNLDRYWRPWRLAAGLAALAFVLGATVNGVQALRLKHQAAAQNAANEAEFRQLFPRESRIVDLQVQLDQQLRALRASGNGGGLFFLLQEAAAGLAASPGLKLRAAQFRDGSLFLDLSGTDLQAAEVLRNYFAGHRAARFIVLDTRSGDGGAQMRVQLSPAAA